MGSIYIIKNYINDKVYIGQTMLTPEERFKQHLKDYSYCDSHLYKAMRTYGKENFYYEVLEDNLSYEKLLIQERFWIQHFNSVKEGYNLTWGGEGHLKYSDDEILDLWRSGLTENEISQNLGCTSGTISMRLKAIGISHEDIVARMVKQAQRREYDPVLQFDLNGNLIKEWDTAAQIERETGMRRSNIKACCNNKAKTAYGYIWKRKNSIGPQRQKAGG